MPNGTQRRTVTHVSTGSTSANTDIDLSSDLPEPMDVRGSNDPIVNAVLIDFSAGSATAQTSQGQGDTTLSSGQIEVIDDQTIQLGDALAAADQLALVYEPRNGGNLPN